MLTHGNWTESGSGGADSQFAILSQYHYRNTPLHPGHYNTLPGGVDHDPPTDADEVYYSQLPITIPYTKPIVKSTANAPAFKTPKVLRGRALVTDGWGKQGNTNTVQRDIQPGFGQLAHQDGYNVLFGDYNTQWYSDQEKRIIYWDIWYHTGESYGGISDNTGGWVQSNNGLCFVDIMVGSKFDSRFRCMTGMESALVWHTFDTNVGIDVHDDDAAYFWAHLPN